jgi:hypothetical protein
MKELYRNYEELCRNYAGTMQELCRNYTGTMAKVKKIFP